jgi:peroxiredoxin
MKRVLFILMICQTSWMFAQRLSFSISNDSIDNEFYLTKINHKVLETVTIESFNFNVDINFEDGYYIFKKDQDEVLLYLKKNDEFSIAYDAYDFHESISFSGNLGGGRNTYLRSKITKQIDDDGNMRPFYERSFYEGNEQDYLRRLDRYYKGFYGTLFGSGFDDDFVNEESKNLQYGYYLDMLKFEKAKKYYQFNDSVIVSDRFLLPLRNIHFDNQLFSDKYPSYNELAIMKWVTDIQNTNDYPVMEDIIASIRTEAIQKGVLVRLYELMDTNEPDRMNAYIDFIKRYSKDNKLIELAKAKTVVVVKKEEVSKKLTQFDFLNTNAESVKLADFKGNYMFIYIWASFCKDCVNEFKNIEKLRNTFEDENIVFIGVSLDKEENFKKWTTSVKENDIQSSAQQLFFNDARSRIIKEYGISSIPAVVLLSGKGEKLSIKIKEIGSEKTEKMLKSLFEE